MFSRIFALILTTLIGMSNGSGIQTEVELLDQLLKEYNPRSRAPPSESEGPTTVHVNLYVRSFDSIDQVKMEYSVQLNFREQWLDPRLAYANLVPKPNIPYLTLTDVDKIWTPDLFFSNEKSGHTFNLLKPNHYVRIFPDGQVLYSLRLALTLSCPMNFKDFPFDKQTCSMRMASYAWTTADIIFKWKRDDPVQVTPVLYVPGFMLEQFTTDYCDSHTNTGVYSCLRVDFTLKRDLSYFTTQVFLPCTILVFVAWLSFWLSKTEVVGRLLLILFTNFMLILAIHFTRAVPVWTGTCFIFVFSPLVEFIIVNFLARRESPAPAQARAITEPEVKRGWNIHEFYQKSTAADKIDMGARIIYPIAFLIFVVAYVGSIAFRSNDTE